jgi:hypothetical protein
MPSPLLNLRAMIEKECTQIGSAPWTPDAIRNTIPEFLELMARRPVADNSGGMGFPHLLATWFLLRTLQPKVVIESGVWKGQGTWLIENTLPQAEIHAIDINLKRRQYISAKARYYTQDFGRIDWSFLANKSDVLVFFDDHQNAMQRIPVLRQQGFQHVIFEDNYPSGMGDCYSLKKAFAHTGHTPQIQGFKNKLKAWLRGQAVSIAPNAQDAALLHQVLEVYAEFPPVYKPALTRWNIPWDARFPTPLPLFQALPQDDPAMQAFEQEAGQYNWLCYARLKTS